MLAYNFGTVHPIMLKLCTHVEYTMMMSWRSQRKQGREAAGRGRRPLVINI